MSLRLSVLDQSPVAQGSSGAQALRNTLDLARLADELGYHRYWVAEHHGGPMLAGPSPEALIGPIAAATEPHPRRQRRRDAAPLQPVQGRRDVQPARGAVPGAHRPRARARRGHRPADRVRAAARPPHGGAGRLPRAARRAARLSRRPRCRPSIPSRGSPRRCPGRPERPEPWLLGSSPQSAVWAAELGMPYAFADFINPQGAEIAALYRERFAARGHGEREPRTAVGVWVICAETDAGGAADRGERADGVHAAAPRAADRRAAARGGRTLPRRGCPAPGAGRRRPRGARGRAAAAANGRRRACRGAPRAARGRARVRRRGGDRRQRHLLARGAPALLRAARGGVRAGR